MVVNENIEIEVVGGNYKYYKDLGYDIPTSYNQKKKKYSFKNGTKIIVKLNDIPKGSGAIVSIKCDCCGEIKNWKIQDYWKQVKHEKTYCHKCATKLFTYKRNINISFYDWCLENSHYDYIDMWDYGLNTKSPKEIDYKSTYKAGFKCKNSSHKPFYKQLNILTKNNYKNGICEECNSIGQWMIDEFGDLSRWSTNNKTSPFSINKNSNSKQLFICSKCGNEKEVRVSSYLLNGLSCDLCKDGFSMPEKYMACILDSLGIDYKCQYNIKTNPSNSYRYDFYLSDYNLIIEMDGHFHKYKRNGISDNLDKVKSYDYEKDIIAKLNNIYVLRLDCSYKNLETRFEYISNNILKSGILNIFNADVDFINCEKLSLESKFLKSCEMYNLGTYSNKEIAEFLNIDYTTVLQYLKRGTILELCKYKKYKKGGIL